MPRSVSLDEVITNAIQPLVQRTSGAIARAIAAMVAEQFQAELRVAVNGQGRRRVRSIRRNPRVELTKWVPDRRARRVPTFVIEATGLDTKKKIVAKYGANAVFKKGKPLPRLAK